MTILLIRVNREARDFFFLKFLEDYLNHVDVT